MSDAFPTKFRQFKKDQPGAMEALINKGWKFELSRSGHLVFINPDGKKVFTGSTPSDRYSWKNCVAELKRYGLVIEKRQK